MSAIDVAVPLRKLEKTWEEKKRKHLRGWHAYGLDASADRLVVFVEPGFSIQDLIAEAGLDIATLAFLDIIETPTFRQMDTGKYSQPSTPLRPGARVFGSHTKGASCHGTIGAFLCQEGDEESVWLLTNRHVLAGQDGSLDHVEVRGAGQTLLSSDAKGVERPETGGYVDAAIARISGIDLEDVDASYGRIPIHCPYPIMPKVNMEVQKLGNASGVTSGKFIYCLPRVTVGDCKGEGESEYYNQFVFASNDTFLSHGDSGALVIGDKHPVAMLFAIADDIPELPENLRCRFLPPFGLANPLATVLDNLPRPNGQKWQMKLSPGPEAGDEHGGGGEGKPKHVCKEEHASADFSCPDFPWNKRRKMAHAEEAATGEEAVQEK